MFNVFSCEQLQFYNQLGYEPPASHTAASALDRSTTAVPPLFKFLWNVPVSSDEMKREREEKKRYLLRKLSFRPTVDDLKNRKVSIYFPFS